MTWACAPAASSAARRDLARLGMVHVSALLHRGQRRAAAARRAGRVIDPPHLDPLLHEAVLIHVVHRRQRPIDGDLREIRPPEPEELRVQVREVPHRQQRIVGEVDPGNHVCRVIRHLLRLGEEVVRVPGQRQLANPLHRDELLRDQLGRVEQIEIRGMARSERIQRSMCVVSGVNEAKSQKVSWAEDACGISRSCSGLTA